MSYRLRRTPANRFYGRDVAEFISTGLAERGFDASHLDEDWGWQAHGKRPDESVLEVSIYHNPDDDPDTENDWVIIAALASQGTHARHRAALSRERGR